MDLINIFRSDDDGRLIEDSCAPITAASSGSSAPKTGDERACSASDSNRRARVSACDSTPPMSGVEKRLPDRDQVSALAQDGLTYTADEYNLDRYGK